MCGVDPGQAWDNFSKPFKQIGQEFKRFGDRFDAPEAPQAPPPAAELKQPEGQEQRRQQRRALAYGAQKRSIIASPATVTQKTLLGQ
jgi:hypothetical protein